MLRIPVLDPAGKPLMPTKSSRARRWVRDSIAVGRWSDLSVYYVQLLKAPATVKTQPIVVGVDLASSIPALVCNHRKQPCFWHI